MLAANHTRLAEDIKQVENAGAKWLHIDIMDGHFVPNLTFGPQTVADLRPQTDLFFDVHLMLSKPHEHVDAFIEAGSQQITIHVEPDYDISGTLEHIKSKGIKAGVVINPGTEASLAKPFLEQSDIVLAMTVQPGFGGQSFQESVMEKTKQLAAWREERGLNFRIEVDGGVGLGNVDFCKASGVDTMVAGTAFFKAKDQISFRKAIES